MPTITATKTGNWSDPTVWSPNPPASGDTVKPNGFTVTIDQNIDIGVGTLDNTTTGGYFAVTAARTIVANIQGGTTICVSCSHTSGTISITGNINGGPSGIGLHNTNTGNLNIVGNITGGGASALNIYGVYNALTGAVNIVGNITGGTGGNSEGYRQLSSGAISTIVGNLTGDSGGNAHAMSLAGAGSTNITGNLVGGNGSTATGLTNNGSGVAIINGSVAGGSGNNSYGIQLMGAGSITVNGNATGGIGSAAYGAYTQAGTITINGDATGGNNGAHGAQVAAGATLTATRAIGNNYGPGGGTASGSGVWGTGGNASVKQAITGPYGQCPIHGSVKIIPDASNLVTLARSDSGTLTLTAITGYPAPADVRRGTVYANGDHTGTAYIPAAASVLYGVPVDATTGTAVTTPEAIASAVSAAVVAAVTDELQDIIDASDPLLNTVPGAYASGSAGHALGRIGSLAIEVTSPVASVNNIEISTNSDYLATDGRALTFTAEDWPTLTGATVKMLIETNAGITAFTATVTGPHAFYIEMTNESTAALPVGQLNYNLRATLTNNSTFVLATGTLTVRHSVAVPVGP